MQFSILSCGFSLRFSSRSQVETFVLFSSLFPLNEIRAQARSSKKKIDSVDAKSINTLNVLKCTDHKRIEYHSRRTTKVWRRHYQIRVAGVYKFLVLCLCLFCICSHVSHLIVFYSCSTLFLFMLLFIRRCCSCSSVGPLLVLSLCFASVLDLCCMFIFFFKCSEKCSLILFNSMMKCHLFLWILCRLLLMCFNSSSFSIQ